MNCLEKAVIATENGLVVSRQSGIAYGELIVKWSQFLFRAVKKFWKQSGNDYTAV